MPQPTLSTARLRLEPLSDEHLAFEVALDQNEEVMRFVGTGKPRSADEVAEAHVGRMARAGGGLGFWAGFIGAEFVGWWLLTAAEDDHRGDAELGYRLDPRFWRQGLATEGAVGLLAYGFDQLGLRKVFAEAMAVNTGSLAVMRRLGMHHTATHPADRFDAVAGAEDGEVVYTITAEQWRQR